MRDDTERRDPPPRRRVGSPGVLTLVPIGDLIFESEAFRKTVRYVRPWMLMSAVGMVPSRIGFRG